MKNRVKMCPPTDGKIEVESDIINCGKNGEGAVALWSEFQRGSEGGDVLAFEPHLIADTIGYRGGRRGPGLVGKGLSSKKIRAKRR